MVYLNNEFALTCENIYSNDLNITTLRCTCDFRINYRGCEEENVLLLVHKLLIPYSIFIIMISLGFIYHRIVCKGQTFLLPHTNTRERGILRLRPQETFHLTTICDAHVTGFIRFVCSFTFDALSYIEICSLLKENFFRYPNSLVAEIYSTPALKFKSKIPDGVSRKQPNKFIVDAIGFFVLIAPFATLFPFACLTGYWANVDYSLALLYTEVHYIILALWGLIFLGSVIYFWGKLIYIIWNRINELKKKECNGRSDIGLTVSTLQRVARNLCLASSVLVVAMMLHIVTVLSYCVIHKDMVSFSTGVNIGYMIAWDCTIPVVQNIIQCIFLYNCLRPMPRLPSSSISDTSSPNRSYRQSFRISQLFPRRDNDRRSSTLYDEEASTTCARSSIIINSQPILPLTNNITEKSVANLNHIDIHRDSKTSIQAIQAEEVKHDSVQSMNSLKSTSKSSRYGSVRNSAKNSISTLSDINIPPEENGSAIYPSSLTPRNSYCLSPNLNRLLQLNLDEIALNNTLQPPHIPDFTRKNPGLRHHRSQDSTMGYIAEEILDDDLDNRQLHNNNSDQNSYNESRHSELDGSSSVSYDASSSTIISPDAAALAKASWAKSEEDLGIYKGNINVSRNTSRSYSSLVLQRDSISTYSDTNDKQEWLKRRPMSPIVRKVTIPRSGLVIKTDY
ncbi:2657_t:CDS:2 [Dentiscutata erythropus]|uniref:2657_t:CDS:1 n=1 Tax=Dentiscutata erythropus TaxID=1348616 RepID=A0A9N9APF7_9GLOM|nr:2657_t:CDS:2 [Dentiscutata erythropus]